MAEIPCITAVVLCKFSILPRYHRIHHAEPPLVFQLVSGALSVSVAQSLFSNRLIASLPLYAPGIDIKLVLTTGATDLRNTFAPDEVHGILLSYLAGLRAAWAMGIGLAGMALLVSFFPEFKSIKGKVGKGTGAA